MASMHGGRSALGVLLTAVLTSAVAAQDNKPEAPFHFSGTTIGGRKIDQDALRPHVAIVDLWGTWCGPCRQVVPVLVGLHQKYAQYGLEIVGFCFDSGGGPEDIEKVRRFATEQKITYQLVPGDSAVRDQIDDFRGYPTMLLFDRDLKLVKTHVGFSDQLAEELERFVRERLQLDAPAGKDGKAAEDKEPPEEHVDVPKGKLFAPGNGDRDVAIDLELLDGTAWNLAGSHGKPVLLAITTTWDQSAQRSAKFLSRLAGTGSSTEIIAWHVERELDATRRRELVRTFMAANSLDCRAAASGLKAVQEKLHRFATLPTFLVFDGDGVLVAREGGINDEVEARVTAVLQSVAAKK